MAGEKGQPREGKGHHNHHQHAHDSLFLQKTWVTVTMTGWSLANVASEPQCVSNHSICDHHDKYWYKVQQQIECHRVQDVQVMSWEVLYTYKGKSGWKHVAVIHGKHWFEALDEELWDEEDK